MTFKIEITDTYVHVLEQRTRRLVDQDTGEIVEVPVGDYASAIGLGDFTTIDAKTGEVLRVDTDAFQAAVAQKITDVCGADLAKVIAAKALDAAVAASQVS